MAAGDFELYADHAIRDKAMAEPASLVAEIRPAIQHAHDSLVNRPSRILRVIQEECAGLHVRLLLARSALALLPLDVGGRVRAFALRLAGFRIGHGTIMAGTPRITGRKNIYRNLVIGRGCWFNVGCFFDLSATIKIGNDVSFGHEVAVLTSSHSVGQSSRRASSLYFRPTTVGDGAWLGSRCTILPGTNIGAGAVVAAGALVNRDVPPNTVVAGVPARPVKYL
jgi:maltose O-acetyltransferase